MTVHGIAIGLLCAFIALPWACHGLSRSPHACHGTSMAFNGTAMVFPWALMDGRGTVVVFRGPSRHCYGAYPWESAIRQWHMGHLTGMP